MSMKLPKCDLCKHCYDEDGKMCCIAFPDGITLEAMKADKEEECKKDIKFEKEQKG